MNGRQIQELERQTGLSAEQLKNAGLISASDLAGYQAQYTGGQRNQMTAGSNVNWAAVYGFSNMSPQDQAAAGAQGLAPTWNGIPMDYMNAHGGVTMTPDGNMLFGDGTQYNRSSGTPAPWAAPAPGSVGTAGNIVEQARALGFRPTGPSGTYAYQAQQFLSQHAAANPAPGGAPGAPGGMPGATGMGMPNFGNSAQQQAAQVSQGSVDQLRQRAAASGDLDRLPYKEARLRGTLAGAKRQQTTQDALAQVQLAQALAQPYADSAAVSAYRGRL